MEISILFFGQLTDITGTDRIRISDVTDTNMLHEYLKKQYPLLEHAKYMMAVNHKIVRKKILLTVDAEVALLPPFSGG